MDIVLQLWVFIVAGFKGIQFNSILLRIQGDVGHVLGSKGWCWVKERGRIGVPDPPVLSVLRRKNEGGADSRVAEMQP